ncbi:unnamed protein product [Dicrocoelium dendriticum]|nr:unnamed protein product [Dicrocoelium dendriticum]
MEASVVAKLSMYHCDGAKELKHSLIQNTVTVWDISEAEKQLIQLEGIVTLRAEPRVAVRKLKSKVLLCDEFSASFKAPLFSIKVLFQHQKMCLAISTCPQYISRRI